MSDTDKNSPSVPGEAEVGKLVQEGTADGGDIGLEDLTWVTTTGPPFQPSLSAPYAAKPDPNDLGTLDLAEGDLVFRTPRGLSADARAAIFEAEPKATDENGDGTPV